MGKSPSCWKACHLINIRTQGLYSTIFGPLSKVPGPWHARWTSFYLKVKTLQGQRVHYVLALHRKYGKVVQISPTEVSVMDLDASREIHRIGAGFLKTKWYIRLRGDLDIFSVGDPEAHATRRRLLSRPFSKSSMRADWEQTVREK